MSEIWNIFLYHPLINGLILLCQLTGNLGWAIIILTIGLRVIMTPLIIPSLKINKKIQELAPEIAKLKIKHKDDKQGLMVAQAALYKQHGANPASGCLPQIIQLIVLIALLNALNSVLAPKPGSPNLVTRLNPILYSFTKLPDKFTLSTQFLYLNLLKPDTITLPGVPMALPGFFLLASALVQVLSAKMMMPVVAMEKKIADKTPQESDDVAAMTQQQMLILFPIMTIIFGYQFPSGLVLYWFMFSLISIIQQYTITGWGGLTPWLKKVNLLK